MFYHLSFCDLKKPRGQQFLGATIIEADTPQGAAARSIELCRSPGGEVAITELPGFDPSSAGADIKRYLTRLVLREEVLSEPHYTMDDMPEGAISASMRPKYSS